MSYYKCACGAEFEEFATGYTGVEYAGVRETEGVCPSCGGSDVDEGRKCEICGEWFDGHGYMCDDCRAEAETLDNIMKYGAGIKTDDGINPALLYVFLSMNDVSALNRMMYESIKSIEKQKSMFNTLTDIGSIIDDFVSDDYSAFDDWYIDNKKKERKQTA